MRAHRGKGRSLRRARRDLADERKTSRALARECWHLWREVQALRQHVWELDAQLDALWAKWGVYRPASTALPEARRRKS